MTRPGYEDATLMMRLAEWHTASGLPAALNWLWSDNFVPEYRAFVQRYPAGSEGDCIVSQICAFFEAVGTLYKHGMLNEELIFDWLAAGPVWDKLKGYILGRRADGGMPTLWANFEALAIAHKRSAREYST